MAPLPCYTNYDDYQHALSLMKNTRRKYSLQIKTLAKSLQILADFSTLMQQFRFLGAARTVDMYRIRTFNMNYTTESNMATAGLWRKKEARYMNTFSLS